MVKYKNLIYTLIVLSGAGLTWVIYSSQPGSGPQIETESNQMIYGDLAVTIPDGWIVESPKSSMRIGQLRLPGKPVGKPDAELAVFSGIGGGVEANLERWFNQFEQIDGSSSSEIARIQNIEVNNLPVTLADLSGTFIGGGMPMSQSVYKKNQRMIAAIVHVDGDYYYFKLLGHQETINYWTESFSNFVSSIKSIQD
tara:strand:+ start:9128 stop:9718 length:591 start_codon:yes stop_codon:yes gene_type:complete